MRGLGPGIIEASLQAVVHQASSSKGKGTALDNKPITNGLAVTTCANAS